MGTKIEKRNLLSYFGMLLAMALLTASCASDGTVQGNSTATFDGSQPGMDSWWDTRTTATHAKGRGAEVFWDASDRIYVQDDEGVFWQSVATTFPTSASKEKAKFCFSSGTYNTDGRTVHYTGTVAGADANTVSIPSTQSQ